MFVILLDGATSKQCQWTPALLLVHNAYSRVFKEVLTFYVTIFARDCLNIMLLGHRINTISTYNSRNTWLLKFKLLGRAALSQPSILSIHYPLLTVHIAVVYISSLEAEDGIVIWQNMYFWCTGGLKTIDMAEI